MGLCTGSKCRIASKLKLRHRATVLHMVPKAASNNTMPHCYMHLGPTKVKVKAKVKVRLLKSSYVACTLNILCVWGLFLFPNFCQGLFDRSQ